MKKENSNKDNLAIHTLVVFRRAERKLQSVEGKVVKAHHLTPMQFGVLEVLYTNGPLHVGDIIEKNAVNVREYDSSDKKYGT